MKSFMRGLGIGIVAGAAVGLAVSPKKMKRTVRHHATRAARRMSGFVDDIMK